jgi:23S rRNA (cytidine1920-2'-O)/16S rRNA (cytidine1409-2'-O)-methyltransferase
VSVTAPQRRFVSRGGDKLDGALVGFSISVEGRRALDAGCATGGFTDCLLKRGAREVVAVDVAYGQFDWGLRNDPRVDLHERTNIRHLTLEEIEGPVDLVCADLSFIGLGRLAPVLTSFVDEDDAEAVLLVKPQFELPRDLVPRGGVVREPSSHRHAVSTTVAAYLEEGWHLHGLMESPLTGPKGNREFLIWLRRLPADRDADALIAEVFEEPA